MTTKPEIWGVAEIAEHLGYTASLIHRWIREGRLPEPVAELKMGKVWEAETIREWNRTRVADWRNREIV